MKTEKIKVAPKVILYNDLEVDRLLELHEQFNEYTQDMTTGIGVFSSLQVFSWLHLASCRFLKAALSREGFTITTTRDCLLEGFKRGLIHDPEVWFDMKKTEDAIFDLLEQDKIEKALVKFDGFKKEFDYFVKKLIERGSK